MPIFPAFGRQRQEDYKFKTSLDYIASLCLKKQKVLIKSNPLELFLIM
jgi:hypothetical protein